MCVAKFPWGRRLLRGSGWLLMRLALGCVALGEALADLALRCAIWGSVGGPPC